MALIQELSCPCIVYHLALMLVVKSQKDTRLNHSSFSWVAFTLVALDLLLYGVTSAFSHPDASSSFIVDAISARMDSAEELSFLKVILLHKLIQISDDTYVSIYPNGQVILLQVPVRTDLDDALLLDIA